MTYDEVKEALSNGELTIEQAAEKTGWPIVQDCSNGHCLLPRPGTWTVNDGNAPLEIEADSAEEAAQEYVDGGDWGDRSETQWISVSAWRTGLDADGNEVSLDRESIDVTLDAEEPECTDSDGHDWQSPQEIVGGCKESPGVFGHGGGVTIDEVCIHCGCGKTIDTWAQNPSNGRQGLKSVSYEPGKYADAISGQDEEA